MVPIDQGLPGDGRDHTGARKMVRGAWGVVNSARKKKYIYIFLNSLKLFYSLPIAKYCPHMPSNSIKCKGNLGRNHS
jgi:hypothetical protein